MEYSKLLEELKIEYNNCNELFNIAWNLNNDENTRTAFSQKVTTYIPDVMQTLSHIIGEIEREQIQGQTLLESEEIEKEYDDIY